MNLNEIAIALDMTYDRILDIAEALFGEGVSALTDEQMEAVETVAQKMLELGTGDVTVAIAALQEQAEADSIPQTFGTQSDHEADLAVAEHDGVNRWVGYQLVSDITFAYAVANGVNGDRLTQDQKSALVKSRQMVQTVVSQRLAQTESFLQQVAEGKHKPAGLTAVATPATRNLLASAKQV